MRRRCAYQQAVIQCLMTVIALREIVRTAVVLTVGIVIAIAKLKARRPSNKPLAFLTPNIMNIYRNPYLFSVPVNEDFHCVVNPLKNNAIRVLNSRQFNTLNQIDKLILQDNSVN